MNTIQNLKGLHATRKTRPGNNCTEQMSLDFNRNELRIPCCDGLIWIFTGRSVQENSEYDSGLTPGNSYQYDSCLLTEMGCRIPSYFHPTSVPQ